MGTDAIGWLRILVSFVIPLVLGGIAWKLIRDRSFQSATGMLYLVVVFGDALDDHVGLWTWPFLLAVVALTGFVRHRVFAFDVAVPGADAAPGRPASVALPHHSQLHAVPRAVKRMRWR